MKDIKPGTVRFYQIFPQQPLPCLAKEAPAISPKRAKLFCPPFQNARNAGILFYPPIDFEAYVDDDHMTLRVNAGTDNEKNICIHKNPETPEVTYLLLQDVSQDASEHCLAEYRRRLAQTTFPAELNPKTFGFYEVMVNGLYEADVDAFYLQIWLGGVIKTAPGQQVWVKHPTNHLLNKQGYTCLDGIVATDQWHGWFAAVLSIDVKQTWVPIRTDQPICQIVPYMAPDNHLDIITHADTPTEVIEHPIQWHILDASYGRKPGKYQRCLHAKNEVA